MVMELNTNNNTWGIPLDTDVNVMYAVPKVNNILPTSGEDRNENSDTDGGMGKNIDVIPVYDDGYGITQFGAEDH